MDEQQSISLDSGRGPSSSKEAKEEARRGTDAGKFVDFTVEVDEISFL